MASRNENVPTVVYYDAYVADCDEGIEFKGRNKVLVSMRSGMTFNALKTKIQRYAMTQPEFFHHNRELQEDNPHSTTWLDQIPREQWTLIWENEKRWDA
ncbi:hypothetical protein JHK87_024325 [Glycine soja]|nr:hypothetical protein JHK87_024325 [Glycine soja]